MNKTKQLFTEIKLLQRSIPSTVLALFVLSVVAMNLLANKSMTIPSDYLAVDCGILFSWLTFLLMDMMVKRFGPRASTLVSIYALAINLFMALMLFLGGAIPGSWGESFVESAEQSAAINVALDNTFRGTWYVLLGSSIAFLVSAVANNWVNWGIGKLQQKAKKTEGFGSFALRSYVSTFISQFVDNITFALFVSLHFFGWTLTQCIVCALTGAFLELLCEVIFSPVGYVVSKKWEKENVGHEYLDYAKEQGYLQ